MKQAHNAFWVAIAQFSHFSTKGTAPFAFYDWVRLRQPSHYFSRHMKRWAPPGLFPSRDYGNPVISFHTVWNDEHHLAYSIRWPKGITTGQLSFYTWQLYFYPWQFSFHSWQLSSHLWQLSFYRWQLSFNPWQLSFNPWQNCFHPWQNSSYMTKFFTVPKLL